MNVCQILSVVMEDLADDSFCGSVLVITDFPRVLGITLHCVISYIFAWRFDSARVHLKVTSCIYVLDLMKKAAQCLCWQVKELK